MTTFSESESLNDDCRATNRPATNWPGCAKLSITPANTALSIGKKLDKAGAKPGDIKRWRTCAACPSSVREDFRLAYPLGNALRRSGQDVREMHMSSGSTGTPVVMAYTEEDLNQWAECMARCYYDGRAQHGRRHSDHPLLRALQRRVRLLPRRAQGGAVRHSRRRRQHARARSS